MSVPFQTAPATLPWGDLWVTGLGIFSIVIESLIGSRDPFLEIVSPKEAAGLEEVSGWPEPYWPGGLITSALAAYWDPCTSVHLD